MLLGIVGPLGAGKTARAVSQSVRFARERGVRLLSTVTVTAPGVECHRLPVGRQGLEVEALVDAISSGGVVLLDEVGVLLPARWWQRLPPAALWVLVHARKFGSRVIWTSQAWEDADAVLRRRTEVVEVVRRIPRAHPLGEWRRPWFLWIVGYAGEPGVRERRLYRSLVRYRREWERWYDTRELVGSGAVGLAAGGSRPVLEGGRGAVAGSRAPGAPSAEPTGTLDAA